MIERFLPRGRGFVAAAVAIAAFKLWITSYIRTVPLYAPHDATNFLDHAQSILQGGWFGPYSSFTLIKGAFFPVYLAAIAEFGVSLSLAHQLTYLVACWIACVAVAPIVRSRAALLGVGIILVFNPMTFDYMSSVAYRSQVSGTLSLLTLACAAALYVRRADSVRARLPWALGLGFSLGALWLTREEGIWIVPCLIVLAGAATYHAVRHRRAGEQSAVPLVLVPSAIWVAMVAIVCALNAHYYGWGVTTELQSREYIGAYASLARISHAPTEVRVPVPKEAREIAYRISPLARQLEPFLDGAQAQRSWFDISCRSSYSCTDIAGGWFQWALRSAVELAGYYHSGQRARRFYAELSQQIDRACDTRQIRCEAKRATLAPPLAGQFGNVAAHFAWGWKLFSQLGTFGIDAWEIHDTPAATLKEYAFVTRDVLPVAQPPATYDQQFKQRFLSGVARIYGILLPIGFLVIAIATIARIAVFVLRRVPIGDASVVFLATSLSGFLLLTILAIIDALSFPGFNDDYFAPLYSVTFFALATLAATDGAQLLAVLTPAEKRA